MKKYMWCKECRKGKIVFGVLAQLNGICDNCYILINPNVNIGDRCNS